MQSRIGELADDLAEQDVDLALSLQDDRVQTERARQTENHRDDQKQGDECRDGGDKKGGGRGHGVNHGSPPG